MIKSTLDSLCYQTYELNECMEKASKIKITQIKDDCGMKNNKNFLQSLSNITQTKILKPKNIETTSLGAAYLTGLHSGIINNTNNIMKLWQKDTITNPIISKSIANSNIEKWKIVINAVNKFY